MRAGVRITAAVLAAAMLAACQSGSAHTVASAPATSRSSPVATRSPSASTSSAPPAPTSSSPTSSPPGAAPVIVIDPGHSPSIHAIDPANGLDVSDYENEPEMHDVFAVALLVRAQLVALGYRVVMTKTSVDERVSLAQRAAIADAAHADLALSIHDQAGSNGGIGFRAGNNIVYYQSVGTYRSTAAGKRIYFTDAALAAVSRRYGAVFAAERRRIEGTAVTLQANTGYNLGARGLAGGDIWMVQLLSDVPWIYNESGGNSAGQIGLDAADRATYARALVASVEDCIPPPH